jgi:ATP-dependent exoDNAse (exonuclease V) alpha subunit
MIAAPTGTAARHVFGSTIHTLLKLPVQHGNRYDHYSLSARTLQNLRRKFSAVRFLIIDEISMVSATLLSSIYERLWQSSGKREN